MAVGDYITVDQLRNALAIKTNLFDDELQLAVSAASRMIDEFCSDQFWNPDTPEARVFTPVQRWRLLLPSFATTSGLSVAVDNDGDGTFETAWTVGTDFQATPTAPRPGWPYTGIDAVGSVSFPGVPGQTYLGWTYGYPYGSYSRGFGDEFHRSTRARVQVTALWGWPSVPAPVQQACQIQAIDLFKSRELTGTSYGAQHGQSVMQKHLSGCNELAFSLLKNYRTLALA